MSEKITNYPLCWPDGWRRTPGAHRKHALFHKEGRTLTMGEAVQRVITQLSPLGVREDQVIFSTNVRVRLDGQPLGNQRKPEDPGVAVYWLPRGQKIYKVVAVDLYHRVEDNLAGVAATIEALRAVERHGGATILDRAFKGFQALPAPVNWRTVFGLPHAKSFLEVKAHYRILAQKRHPDVAGGSTAAMAELNTALEDAKRELGEATIQ